MNANLPIEMTDDDRVLYQKVARDAGGNIAFAWLVVAVVWVLSGLWMPAAKALFWVGAAVLAVDLVRYVLLTGAGIVLATKGQHNGKWIWAANLALLIENGICVIALYVAARAIGYLQ